MMGEYNLVVSCSPVNEVNPVGGSIPIRVEITNLSNAAIEIISVGIPWQSFYAIEFKVKNKRGFQRALPESVPRELPATRIPAGGSASGEVDLGRYLRAPTGESIARVAGDYVIDATVNTSIPVHKGGYRQIQLRSKPFTVRIVAG